MSLPDMIVHGPHVTRYMCAGHGLTRSRSSGWRKWQRQRPAGRTLNSSMMRRSGSRIPAAISRTRKRGSSRLGDPLRDCCNPDGNRESRVAHVTRNNKTPPTLTTLSTLLHYLHSQISLLCTPNSDIQRELANLTISFLMIDKLLTCDRMDGGVRWKAVCMEATAASMGMILNWRFLSKRFSARTRD